jgi:Ca2+-binding EF-hand superfamily protein
MTAEKRTTIPPTTSRSMSELRRDFASSDRDHDGRIDFTEFREFLAGLDEAMSEEEARIGFHEIDTDHDGRIDLTEFARWWNED